MHKSSTDKGLRLETVTEKSPANGDGHGQLAKRLGAKRLTATATANGHGNDNG